MHTKGQEGPRIVKFIEVESRIMVTRGWRQEGESVFNGNRVAVWEDETFLEMGGGDDCRTTGMYNAIELYT